VIAVKASAGRTADTIGFADVAKRAHSHVAIVNNNHLLRIDLLALVWRQVFLVLHGS